MDTKGQPKIKWRDLRFKVAATVGTYILQRSRSNDYTVHTV